jgi:uncharacterized protein YndB with AHSA1/START domain
MQNGKATTEKKTFSRTTSVSIAINAEPAIVWKLLTNAPDFARWNSTVISIEGNIGLGAVIKLKSKLAPKRTFKLKVTAYEAPKRLEWGDAQGARLFTLMPNGKGALTFSMSEKIGSFMFPLYAKYIPSFDESFEQFAADLKREAETIQNTNK